MCSASMAFHMRRQSDFAGHSYGSDSSLMSSYMEVLCVLLWTEPSDPRNMAASFGSIENCMKSILTVICIVRWNKNNCPLHCIYRNCYMVCMTFGHSEFFSICRPFIQQYPNNWHALALLTWTHFLYSSHSRVWCLSMSINLQHHITLDWWSAGTLFLKWGTYSS